MKIFRYSVAIVLALLLTAQIPLSAVAASKKKQYVSEVILSYGATDDDAKKWLTDNGYEVVDNNLNEGADDLNFLSVKRSVYLGYKTTTDADEAITDLKLMNMNGGYSVQDYRMLLEEKKTDIQSFIDSFTVVLDEYRENYNNGVQRAVAAHDELNMFYDDDTGMAIGDLLLNKIKEEYTDEEFSALSEDEQKTHADMTTILMQGSSELVLTIEQLLATATDTSSKLWIERYQGTDCYDDMVDALVDGGMTLNDAEKELSRKYDETATVLAALADEYREWLAPYLDSGVSITSGEDELNEYLSDLSDEDKIAWLTKGFQCLLLEQVKISDGSDLFDLFTGDYDLEGGDRTMLYPLASVLSDGQKAGLQFMFGSQFVQSGFSGGTELINAVSGCKVQENEKALSVFDGVDRSVYEDGVALTGEAYKLQTSTDKDYSTNWFSDGISATTKILGIVSAVTFVAAIGTFAAWKVASDNADAAAERLIDYEERLSNNIDVDDINMNDEFSEQARYWTERKASCLSWSKFFAVAGIGITIVTIILSGITLWQTYENLKEYYHADFTPIPGWMVDEATDENDEKVFTYYKAVLCNRVEANFVTDNNALLGSFGDINGDAGKQWVALYTTKDRAAGNPVTADFTVQYANSSVPGTSIPLSIFCEATAQNLTNAKAGYTYNDSKGGIYLFFNEDASAFAGSAITTGGYIAIAAGAAAIAAAAVFFIIRAKKKKTETAEQ